MKKLFYLVLPTFLLFACGSESEETDLTEEGDVKTEQPKGMSDTQFTALAKQHLMTALDIPVNEKFEFQVYRKEINSDTILDAIVTVNRLEYAMDKAIKEGRQAKAAEIGFTGMYNYFFYYDGATAEFSVPIPIGSSPGRPLDVEFANILSPIRNDVILTYRIRNSAYKSYYSVLRDRDFTRIFQWKYFDKVGEDNPEAILHKLVDNGNPTLDIYIYKSEINNYNKNISDIYEYVPQITKEKQLEYKFTYDANFEKYKILK